jgi:hypothetical protein
MNGDVLMVSPFQGSGLLLPITWASARVARFSPGYNIAGLQPCRASADRAHHWLTEFVLNRT